MPAERLVNHRQTNIFEKEMDMRLMQRNMEMVERYGDMSFILYGSKGARWWKELQNLNKWVGPWNKRTMTGRMYIKMSSRRGGSGRDWGRFYKGKGKNPK